MRYIQFFNKAPMHINETREIADLVAEDLARRGADLTYKMDSDAGIHLDFGGAIIVGNPYQTVPTRSGVQLTFFNQHYSFVRAAVTKAKAKGDRGGYYKIHTSKCVCLAPETFEDLAKFLEENGDRLLLEEVAEAERFYEVIAEVKQSPYVE